MGKTGVTMWIVGVINLLAKSPNPPNTLEDPMVI